MSDITYFKGSDHLEAKKVQWRAATGRFLLEFASIEWFTYHIINELPTERIFESTKDLPFRKRADLAIQLLQGKGLDESLTQKAISLLKESIKLAEKRNILAHSPLLLNLFDEAVGPDLKFDIFRYGDSVPEISFEDLEQLCLKVEAITRELYIVIDRVREEIGDVY